MDEAAVRQQIRLIAEAVVLSLGGIQHLQASSILVVWACHEKPIYAQVGLLTGETLEEIATLNPHRESKQLIAYAPATQDPNQLKRFFVAATIAAELFHLASPLRRQIARGTDPPPSIPPLAIEPSMEATFQTAAPTAATRLVRATPAHEEVAPSERIPYVPKGGAITRYVDANTPDEKREARINLVKTLTSLVAIAIAAAYLFSYLLTRC